jgi:hypothetical protein
LSELDRVAGIAVSVEDDPLPVVAALANDLTSALTNAAFADATRTASGTVAIRSALTPQAATVRVADGRVELAHGTDGDADVSATIGAAGDGGAAIDGSGELAEWAARLLDPPLPSWQQAAERFWAVLSSRSGAPHALLVVELGSGEQRRFGSEDGSACELHGAADGLVALLTGRTSMIEAAFEGAVQIRGTFPDLSTLSGAGFEIRYGDGAVDG